LIRSCVSGRIFPELDFLDNIEKVNTHAHAAAVRSIRTLSSATTPPWKRCSGGGGVFGEPQPEVVLSDIASGERDCGSGYSTDKPIFQTAPFVALKDVYENYMIVPMEETGIYRMDLDQTVTLANTPGKGGYAAVTDTTGNLETRYAVNIFRMISTSTSARAGTPSGTGAWADSDRAAWFNRGRCSDTGGLRFCIDIVVNTDRNTRPV
jgi:hypothetical protein